MPTEIINDLKINHRGNVDIGVIKEVFFENPYQIEKIPNNSIVIDIGAHIGTFSIRCANDRDCTVYSYEPCKENYDLLIENIKINNLNNKIKAFNKAVSNKSCIREFYIDPVHYAGCSFLLKDLTEQKLFDRPYHTVRIGCVTLRQIFDDNNITHCDILKLDCEGEEKNIILDKNASDILDKIYMIILEHHWLFEGKKMTEYLRGKGFTVYSNNQFKAEGGILHAVKNADDSLDKETVKSPESYLRELLMDVFPDSKIESLIDIGTGHGGVFDFWEWEKRGLKLKVCTDIHCIREDIPNTWQKIITDGINIPYGDNTFDVVMCCEVMGNINIDKRDEFIKELERLSRRLIFITITDHIQRWGLEKESYEKKNSRQKYIEIPNVNFFIDHGFKILYAGIHHIKAYKVV